MDKELKMHFVFQNCNLNLRQMVRSEEFVDCLVTRFRVSMFLIESLWKGKSKPVKDSANIISIIKRILNNEIIIDFIFQNLKKNISHMGGGQLKMYVSCLSVCLSVFLSQVCIYLCFDLLVWFDNFNPKTKGSTTWV